MPYQEKDPQQTGIGAKFSLGKVVYSEAINGLITGDPVAAMTLNTFLRFHHNREVENSDEIVSSYQLQGRAILIVTDAEPRERTRVMLREEYGN